MIRFSLEQILGVHVNIIECLHCKDLLDTLSTCQASADKNICGDVTGIRYEFRTIKVNLFLWYPE